MVISLEAFLDFQHQLDSFTSAKEVCVQQLYFCWSLLTSVNRAAATISRQIV